MRGGPNWLVAASALGLCLIQAPPTRAQVPDHLKCYKVRDPQATKSYSADLGGLIPEPGCTIRVPAVMACLPATKSNVDPSPPGGGATGTPNAFGCYKVKCPKVTPPTISLADQFGNRVVTPTKAKLLCAPASATSTTTSTTRPLNLCTTTTIPRCGSGPPPNFCPPTFAECPGGQTCQTDASGCSCVGPAPACDAAGGAFCSAGTCPPGQSCQTVCNGDGTLSCTCR
jgi:hypothetical protein